MKLNEIMTNGDDLCRTGLAKSLVHRHSSVVAHGCLLGLSEMLLRCDARKDVSMQETLAMLCCIRGLCASLTLRCHSTGGMTCHEMNDLRCRSCVQLIVDLKLSQVWLPLTCGA